MQAKYHVAASIMASAVTYTVSNSATMAAVTLVSGIFIDVDHLIDYVALHRPPYSIKDFFYRYYNNRLTHALLVLHSWELLCVVAIAAMATKWNPVATGLFIGMGHHLLLDQIFNRPYPLGYFLTFRIFSRLSFVRCFRCPSGAPNNEKSP